MVDRYKKPKPLGLSSGEVLKITKDYLKTTNQDDLECLYRAISRVFIGKMIKKQMKNTKRVKPWK